MSAHNRKPYARITLEEVCVMLLFISPESREDWLSVLMALKSEFGDDAYSVADDWSQSGSSYKPRDFKAVWKSIKPGKIKIGTLIYMAKQNGWSRNNQPVSIQLPAKKAPQPQTRSTAAYALKLYLASNNDDSQVMAHPYSIKKGIESAGGAGRGIVSGALVGKPADCIIVPIRNIETDKVQGVQCINTEGAKQTFGAVSGGALLLGNTLNKSLIWYVCEGWASAYSVVFHHQKGNGVCACSFGKSNLDKVAELIAEVYQPDEMAIIGEVD